MDARLKNRSGKDQISLDAAPDFFDPRTLSKILGVAEGTAYEMAKAPGFPATRIGRRIIVSKAGLLRWMGQQGLA